VLWNLAQLANALLSAGVLSRDDAQAAVDAYSPGALAAAHTRLSLQPR
jgi:hypothetical protein